MKEGWWGARDGTPYAVLSPNGAGHSLSGRVTALHWRGGLLVPAEKLAKPTTPLRLGIWPATNSQLGYGMMFVSTPRQGNMTVMARLRDKIQVIEGPRTHANFVQNMQSNKIGFAETQAAYLKNIWMVSKINNWLQYQLVHSCSGVKQRKIPWHVHLNQRR